MSEFSVRMAAMALALLQKRGQSMTLEREAQGTMAADGVRVPTPSPSAVIGVFLPSDGTTMVDGVERRAAKVILAAADPAPKPGNHVVIPSGPNAGEYLVSAARNWAPEGQLIYSDLEVAL